MSQQNVYDDPAFFAGYKQLREADSGLNGALEMPAIAALMPELRDLDVLDLGCGFGDFARKARADGARSVLGVDLSENMLRHARSLTSDPNIQFVLGSAEAFDLGLERWDLVVSSLALHYVEDYLSVVRRIASSLKLGGVLVFSVEHPMVTAHPVGWIRDDHGNPLHWPLDRYADESIRRTRWFIDGVEKFHRTVSTYLNGLVAAGLTIERVSEPLPTQGAISARPDLETECKRPAFLLLKARKR